MCVLAVVVKKKPKNSQPKQIDINYAAEKKWGALGWMAADFQST